ncbi:MAG: rhomboid family intramembrane serine protease [Flavobacteriia bacterium]|nr:rhomboid family intramembrane serine protease [Flavobacteriia bacterium]
MFLLSLLWLIQWAQHLFTFPFHTLGILPQRMEGLKGILLMPFIHDKNDLNHLLNNSVAFLVLSTLLFYAYRSIALPVLLISWIFGGLFVWIFAANHGAYHIGLSGVIYALVAFIFFSGAIRKYFPLQAMALLVVFLYGSTLWGIFPIEPKISWEGHLAGFICGFFLAVFFRHKGPQRPKYTYEIEQEMGIEPPDFEGEWLKKHQAMEENNNPLIINYHFLPNTTPPTPNPSVENIPPAVPSPDQAPEDPSKENPRSPNQP